MAVLENRPEEAASNFDPVEVCPLLFTTRLSTARMLIELEEWDKAAQVLDGLIGKSKAIVMCHITYIIFLKSSPFGNCYDLVVFKNPTSAYAFHNGLVASQTFLHWLQFDIRVDW